MARNRREASSKERIDRAAYKLFTRYGIRAVGVDTVTARSGVAKMTLYRHYASKSDLALAFLRRRGELFSRKWQVEAEARGRTPAERLLAIFDLLDAWFHQRDYAGCPVVKVSLERDSRDPAVRKAALEYFATVRAFLRRHAAEAGVNDPDAFARQWHMLIKGCIVDACAGDRDAAQRAKALGALLLRSEAVPAKR